MDEFYNPDGHLTYSYSEDEEDEMYSPGHSPRSLPRSTSSSRSPSLTRSPLMTRSTDSSLRRRTLQRNFKSSQNPGTIRSSHDSEHYQKLGRMLSDLSRQSECFDSTLKRLEKESEEQLKQSQMQEQSPVSREELKDKIESVNSIMLGLECETTQLLEVKHSTISLLWQTESVFCLVGDAGDSFDSQARVEASGESQDGGCWSDEQTWKYCHSCSSGQEQFLCEVRN